MRTEVKNIIINNNTKRTAERDTYTEFSATGSAKTNSKERRVASGRLKTYSKRIYATIMNYPLQFHILYVRNWIRILRDGI